MRQMFNCFYPNQYVPSLFEINTADLKERGIKGILFDLDNTIIPWDLREVNSQVKNWLAGLQDQGFKLCIVSNNNRQRVAEQAVALNIPAIHKAGKPRLRSIRQAMDLIGTKTEDTALVGDQVFTDIFGGNRLGLHTILVVPLAGKEFIGTKVNRQLEKVVLYRYKKRLAKPNLS